MSCRLNLLQFSGSKHCQHFSSDCKDLGCCQLLCSLFRYAESCVYGLLSFRWHDIRRYATLAYLSGLSMVFQLFLDHRGNTEPILAPVLLHCRSDSSRDPKCGNPDLDGSITLLWIFWKSFYIIISPLYFLRKINTWHINGTLFFFHIIPPFKVSPVWASTSLFFFFCYFYWLTRICQSKRWAQTTNVWKTPVTHLCLAA